MEATKRKERDRCLEIVESELEGSPLNVRRVLTRIINGINQDGDEEETPTTRRQLDQLPE